MRTFGQFLLVPERAAVALTTLRATLCCGVAAGHGVLKPVADLHCSRAPGLNRDRF